MTQHNPLSGAWAHGSGQPTGLPENSSPAAFIQWLPEPEPWEHRTAITSTVGPDTGASAARDFYFRPSKKLSKKVCRKFQEAVIGPAAAGQQWPDARHWGLGSENSKYCNKVSPEFWEAVTRWCSCDQWEGFMTNNQVLPETRHPVPTRLRGRAVLKQLFCVDFSKEPLQHKRLNSNAKTRRGMGNHSFTFMFLWILFGCDWIEGERMRERAAVMWLGEASPE